MKRKAIAIPPLPATSLGRFRTHESFLLLLVEAFTNLHDYPYFLVFVFFVSSLCQGRSSSVCKTFGNAIEARSRVSKWKELKRKDGVAFVVSISIFNEASKA